MSRVMVTGGAGFIGRFLLRKLSRLGYDVVNVDVYDDVRLRKELPRVKFYSDFDISSENNPDDLWKEVLEDVEVVFHLAGLLGTTELFHRIIEAEKVNVFGTLNLLGAMHQHDVGEIVFTSKPNPWIHNVYTITKLNCEHYLNMYREIYGFKPVILRPYNVYGPEEKIEHYRKAVPYFIIAALRNQPIEVFGDGEQTMDLIHVRDCVDGLIASAREPRAIGEAIDLGSGQETKVNDLAQKTIELTGSKSKVVHLPMRKGEKGPRRIFANTKKMEEILGFKPRINLTEGLKDTISHYKDNLHLYSKIYTFVNEDFQEG